MGCEGYMKAVSLKDDALVTKVFIIALKCTELGIVIKCIMYNAVFIIMENEKSSSFTPPKIPAHRKRGKQSRSISGERLRLEESAVQASQ